MKAVLVVMGLFLVIGLLSFQGSVEALKVYGKFQQNVTVQYTAAPRFADRCVLKTNAYENGTVFFTSYGIIGKNWRGESFCYVPTYRRLRAPVVATDES